MGAGAAAGIAAAVEAAVPEDLEVLSKLPSAAKVKLLAALTPELEQESVTVTSGIDTLGTLIHARSECFEGAFVNMCIGASEPNFENISALLESQLTNEELVRQTKNLIKKCTKCGKANAKTLNECNACGFTLPAEVTTSLNICILFIYGIAPLKVSIRYQSEDVLVYDDLMQCTLCHFNAISTKHYVQDWRLLLKRPHEALALIDALSQAADEAMRSQFWSHSKWKDKFLHPSARNMSFEDLRGFVCAGFNYPPSQYQLHLQYLLPPLVPYQFQMVNEGKAFLYGRFFPVTYVREVLAKAVDGQNVPGLGSDTDVETIVAHFDALGIVYKEKHDQFLEQLRVAQCTLANWQPGEFACRLTSNGVIACKTQTPIEADFREMVKEDQLVFQNYGRPYVDGKPSGMYYKYARKSGCLETW